LLFVFLRFLGNQTGHYRLFIYFCCSFLFVLDFTEWVGGA
jgi:hypothetical protein